MNHGGCSARAPRSFFTKTDRLAVRSTRTGPHTAENIEYGDIVIACRGDDSVLSSNGALLDIAGIYNKFSQPLAAGLPILQEIMLAQKKSSWCIKSSGAFDSAFKYMKKVWAHVNAKRRTGMNDGRACGGGRAERAGCMEGDAGGRRDRSEALGGGCVEPQQEPCCG